MFKLFKEDIVNLFVSPTKIGYTGFSKNLKEVLFYYFILTVLLLFFSVIISGLDHLLENNPKPFINKKIQLFEVIIIAPILEEVLFRLLMRLNKFNSIIFFIWVLILVLYEKFILGSACVVVLCLLFLFLFSFKKFNYKLNIDQFEAAYFPLSFLIYLSCLLFGAIHLLNFDTIDVSNIIIILYVISKVTAGFVFALLRLKFGIISSILYHIFLNSLAYFLIS